MFLPSRPAAVGLVDGLLHGPRGRAVLVADVDIGDAGLRGVAGEDDPFEHLMRVFFHQDAVVEGAGFALVGVDAHVDGAGVVLGQEGPLQPGGEAGSAAAAQAGVLHRLRHLGGRHFVDGFLQSLVAAVGAVGLQGWRRLAEDAGQEDGFKVGHFPSDLRFSPVGRRDRWSSFHHSAANSPERGTRTSPSPYGYGRVAPQTECGRIPLHS